MNTVAIIGNLTSDPEIRHTQTGKTICSFSIAVNEYSKNKEEKNVSFFKCESWEKTAEIIEKHFKKGHKIGITGRLKQERWESDSGQRSTVKIIVNNIDFLQQKNTSESSSENQENSAQPTTSSDDIPF